MPRITLGMNTKQRLSQCALLFDYYKDFERDEKLDGTMESTCKLIISIQSLHLLKKTDANRSIFSLAKELGISTVHLNRICKQVAGKSAMQLVLEQKVEQSKNYLTHTSYSVSEIAYQLNFEYPNYFARLFKKITGLTPTEYRSKKREEIN